jgi:hypothetical protein
VDTFSIPLCAQVAKRQTAYLNLILQEKNGKDMVHQVEDLPDDDAEKEAQAPPEHVLKNAQVVMDEHTTKLDDHHALFGGC